MGPRIAGSLGPLCPPQATADTTHHPSAASPPTSTVSATQKHSELSPFSFFFHIQVIFNYDVFIQHLNTHTPLMQFNQIHVFTIFIKILTSAKRQQYHIC